MPVDKLTIKIDAQGKLAIKTLKQDIPRAIDGLRGKVKRFGSQMGNVFGGFLGAQVLMGAVRGLTRAMAGAIRTGVRYNMFLEDQAIAMEVLFKSATKATEAIANARKIGAATPFETRDLISATRMLQVFGIAYQKALIPIGNMIGALGGTGADLQSAAYAMGMIQSGQAGLGFKTLRRFGINPRDVAGLEFSKGGALKTDAKEAVQIMINYMSTRFEGGMAKLAETTSGRYSTLLSKWSEATATMTGGMDIKGIIDQLITLIEGINWRELGNSLKVLADWAMRQVKQMADLVSPLADAKPEPLRRGMSGIAYAGLKMMELNPLVHALGFGDEIGSMRQATGMIARGKTETEVSRAMAARGSGGPVINNDEISGVVKAGALSGDVSKIIEKIQKQRAEKDRLVVNSYGSLYVGEGKRSTVISGAGTEK